MSRQHRRDDDSSTDPATGWKLVLLRQHTREARSLATRLEDLLSAFDPNALGAGNGATLGSVELSRAVEAALDFQEKADIVGVIAGGIAARRDALVLTSHDLADESARALRAGSADSASVVLSARLLTPREGFGALADAITSDVGILSDWGALTVRDLLAAFHESDAALVRRVCLLADIHPDTGWADLDVSAIARMSDALRDAADV
jgi:hypothetical protein